jgi:hypothetical protein
MASKPFLLVLIPSTQLQNGITYYAVQVADGKYTRGNVTSGSTPHNITVEHENLKRFREFEQLHKDLMQFYQSYSTPPPTLPEFPGKRWFKNSHTVVAERQKELATYLTALLNTSPFRKSSLLHEFLQYHPDSEYKDVASSWPERYQSVQMMLLDGKKLGLQHEVLRSKNDVLKATRLEKQIRSLVEELDKLVHGLDVDIGIPLPGGYVLYLVLK